jgi:hypothetical protein
MNLRYFALAALACATVQPAFAQTTVQGGTSVQVTPGHANYTNKMRGEGTVTAIDYTARSIALRLQDGREISMAAGPEIRRFNEIKVGDKVVASYEEQLNAKLIKKGSQPIGWKTSSSDHRATEGAPAGSSTTTAILVANITAVDKKTSTVTFKGALESRDLIVEDPKQLALMKVGDQLEVTITATLALSVEPVAAN